MPDLPISGLPSGSLATADQILPIVQGGVTKQITATNLGRGIFNLNLPLTSSGIIVNGKVFVSESINMDTLTYTNEGIANSQLNGDIVLSTLGSGSVSVNRLNFPSGSFINTLLQVDNIYTTYGLLALSDYSTGSLDNLPSSQYNTINGLSAPWTALQLTSSAPNYSPVSSIAVDDVLAGVGISPSSVKLLGGSGYEDIVIVDLDLSTEVELLLPVSGTILTALKSAIKPTFVLETPSSTNLFLNASQSGSVILDSDLIPLTTNTRNLGIPTRRWKEVWVGPGSIYMQDETLGIDLKMTARDGNFVVEGAAGFSVGEFTFIDNEIQLDNPNREIIIGTQLASGSVIFNRPLQVNTIAGSGSFVVDRTGRTQLKVPAIPAGDIGAFNIVGSSNGTYQPVINPGGMIHVTSNDNEAARVTVDGFGSNIGAIFVGRHARGTSDNPTPTLSGDILARFSGLGYSTSSYFPIVGGVPTSLEFQATENYSTSGAGSRAAFYTYANGEVSRSLVATIDTTGLFVSGTLSASLQSGYMWVGDSNNRTTTIPTSSFISSTQTGSFVTNSQTGSFVTNSQTGSFMTTGSLTGNTFTFTKADSSTFNLIFNTSSFITSAQTGSFWTSGSNGNFGFYGAFCSTGSQTNPSPNVSRSMQLETTEHSNGVTIVSGSRITTAYKGVYNLQFSAQLEKTDNGVDTVYIWFKKNGSNVARSTTAIDVLKQAGGSGKNVAAWNYVDTMNAGDYLEIVWQSDDINMQLHQDAAAGNFPSIPSVIATLTQVG